MGEDELEGERARRSGRENGGGGGINNRVKAKM